MKQLHIFLLFLGLFTEGVATAQNSDRDIRENRLKELVSLPNDTNRVKLLYRLSYQYCAYKPDSSYLLAQEALVLARSLHDTKGEIYALRGIAMAYSALNDFGQALRVSFDVVDIYKKNGDKLGLANIFNNIADLYMRQNDWKTALDYLHKSQAVLSTPFSLTRQDSTLIFVLSSNMGECFYNITHLDSARFYLNKAIPFGEPSRHPVVSISYHTLGDVELARKNPQAALAYYQKAIRYLDNSDNFNHLYEVYYRVAKFYQNAPPQYNRDSAIRYGELALDASQKCEYLAAMTKSSLFLSQIYEAQNGAKALHYFKIATTAKDSLNSQERVRQLLSIEFNDKQRQQERLLQEEETRNTLNLRIAFGVLTLVCGIAFALYYNNRQKQKAYNLLSQNKTELDNRTEQLRILVEEKDALLKEIHHRVKNNLEVINSLLTLQTNTIADEKAKAALAEAQSRVYSIALIHHNLYRNETLATVELQGFANDLFKQVQNLFNKNNAAVDFLVEGQNIRIDTTTSVSLGLILNELFTNAFKYAIRSDRANQISLFLENLDTTEKGKRQYKLTYRDNGVGLPASVNLEKTTTLGIKIIKLLTKQIGGQSHFYNENGLVFEIGFGVK